MLTETLLKTVAHTPAVALLGARQVGKTTLARTIARGRASVYLDLESPEDLAKLADPGGFFRAHRGELVILDEIQRAPELFAVLRGVIDEDRWRGGRAGRFLLLGSASMNLLRQTSESLAGRIAYIEMGGLNALEVAQDATHGDSGGGDNNDDGESDDDTADENARRMRTLWLRGGFPNAYLAASADHAFDWLEDLIRTYLERDVPQLGFRVSASRLRRLWTMLAHLQGEPVNTTNLAGNLETQRAAVNQYLEILTDLFLLRRLQPWHANVGKRLVKSPRYYVRDSGVMHRLLGIDNHDALLSHPALGKSWEGFVIENLHSALPRRAATWFYRTAAGAEIDLLIQFGGRELWAVEIKHGRAPRPPKHFHRICADVGATEAYIVYGGTDEYPLGDGATAISLPGLMRRLQGEPSPLKGGTQRPKTVADT